MCQSILELLIFFWTSSSSEVRYMKFKLKGHNMVKYFINCTKFWENFKKLYFDFKIPIPNKSTFIYVPRTIIWIWFVT